MWSKIARCVKTKMRASLLELGCSTAGKTRPLHNKLCKGFFMKKQKIRRINSERKIR